MVVPFIDLSAQYQSIKDEVDRAISQVVHSATFVAGEAVRKFENEFARQLGAKHAIGVGSGSDALFIILKMLGITRGDEVITTALSWVATAESISRTGATPVFVDVDPQTYTINPILIEAKITSRTKAILPVHLYGQMSHVSEIRAICQKHKLHLVEDCAQSHFSSEHGTYAGRVGVASAFSFYPTKNLGAFGNAGCIITEDDLLAEKCRRFSNDGALQRHDHTMEGMNSRMDTLQAAVLLTKLKHIHQWNKARVENAQAYSRLLSSVPEVVLPLIRENTEHTFHLFVIKVNRRDELKVFLESHGIQTQIHYPRALPDLDIYKNYENRENFSVATDLTRQIISLPIYPELVPEQIQFVSKKIIDFFSAS
jgi:dTDP-4-amino-4,6-dideoxygalactose transaminase